MKQFMLTLLIFLSGAVTLMAQGTSSIIITSNIRGAEIFVNGVVYERTAPAFLKELEAGDYIIELRDPYGNSLVEKFKLEAEEVKTLNMDYDVSELTLISSVYSDSVFLNDHNTGVAIGPDLPAYFGKLPKGNYEMRIFDKLYGIEIDDNFFLQADRDTINFKIETGGLSITANEKNAKIFLNGIETQRITPATFTDLPKGVYEITLKKGMQKAMETVHLRPGATTEANIEFKKNRLWTYVTIGAGVIAAGTATYLLTREEQPAGFSDPPGFPSE